MAFRAAVQHWAFCDVHQAAAICRILTTIALNRSLDAAGKANVLQVQNNKRIYDNFMIY